MAEKIAKLWWVFLPRFGHQLAAQLAAIFTDGYYLLAWPWVAAFVSPLGFLCGLLLGWQHWGFGEVFTTAMPVMVLLLALGLLSGHLGMMLWLGFVVGDFFLAKTSWGPTYILSVRVPLIIEYSLLGFLVVGIPLFTKALTAQLFPLPTTAKSWTAKLVALFWKLPRGGRFGLLVVSHVLLSCLFVYSWTQATPLLIRPLFTWQGISPSIEAMRPLQENGDTLIYVTIFASLLRIILQGVTASVPAWTQRISFFQKALHYPGTRRPLVERLPGWLGILLQIAWAVLLFSGMFTNALEAILLGVVMLLLQGLRYLVRLNVEKQPILRFWVSLTAQLPLALRLGCATLILQYGADAILKWQSGTTDTFQPILLSTILSMVVYFVLDPAQPAKKREATP